MSPTDPIPPPPPDDEFSRMVEGALNSDDFSLTENRRAAVLKAFTDAEQAGGQRRRAVHRVCWLAAGAAAAACLAMWISGAFSGFPAARRDEVTKDSPRTQSASTGEQLEQTNLRLAMLSEQLFLAEHQLIWLRATEGKHPPN